MKSLLTTAVLLISIVTAGCDVSCDIVSETPVPGPSDLSTRSIAINFTLDKKEVTSMEVVQNQTRPGNTLISFNFYSSPGRQGTCIGGGNRCLCVLITCGLHRSRPKHFGARAITNRPAVTDSAPTFQGNSF